MSVICSRLHIRRCARTRKRAQGCDAVRVNPLQRRRAKAVGTGLGGLALLLVTGYTADGAINWLDIWERLRPRLGIVLGFIVGLMLLTSAAFGWFLAKARRERRPSSPLSWWAVLAAVVVVALVTWSATDWLLNEAAHAGDPAIARVEAIKTGLGTAAGTAGFFALLLAVRRQWHQEVASRATEKDADEKRVTELYARAVEQLGSAEAHVRLGGLYALERLAQSAPDQQQTIVNVICAYLRMPYIRPAQAIDEDPRSEAYITARQQREVRITAERILTNHLRWEDGLDPTSTYWYDIDIDLQDAYLLEFNFRNCIVRNATFENAEFARSANFDGAIFTGEASFSNAILREPASFRTARFVNIANFSACKFTRDAYFWDSRFEHEAVFRSAAFSGASNFGSAVFFDRADFSAGRFQGSANFSLVQFLASTNFAIAQFIADAVFQKAEFHEELSFNSANFHKTANFSGSLYTGESPDELHRFLRPNSKPPDEPIKYYLRRIRDA